MNRLRAYLELTRLSNLPTVWTNALVGLYAGYTAGLLTSGATPAHVSVGLLLHVLDQGFVLLAALSCLYAGGMALNDVFDEAVDRAERPGRPIPSGRVSRRAAWVFAGCLFAAGLVGLTAYNRLALGMGVLLALMIVAYNAAHQRSPWAVVLMGLCRALVYGTAAAAAMGRPAWPRGLTGWTGARDAVPFAVCVGVYIVIITVVSRRETGPALGGRRWLALLMLPIALLPGLLVRPTTGGWVWVVVAAALLIFWLSRASLHALADPPRTPRAITTWLSGLCLIDAYYLALLRQPEAAAVAVACFLLTALAHRRIAGT